VTNVKLAIVKNILTITVDLSKKGEASKSGKSIVIASTTGNIPVGDGTHMIGLNIYKPVS